MIDIYLLLLTQITVKRRPNVHGLLLECFLPTPTSICEDGSFSSSQLPTSWRRLVALLLPSALLVPTIKCRL